MPIKSWLLLLCLMACPAFAMDDNGDGTRTFYVGSSGDYTTIADLVWVHPVGLTQGDRLRSRGQVLNENFTAQASGTSSLPIKITIGAK